MHKALTLSTKIKKSPGYITKKMAKEVLIFDPLAGQIRRLNETAAFIWQEIGRGTTVKEVADKICQKFEVAPSKAREDVLSLLNKYLKDGLITLTK
ncbi:MAG: PqqD family protein [bacterium]|nr:PqqD family protein [bacterium]